jgi:hypothetical protein
MVVLLHLAPFATMAGLRETIFDFGNGGVDLFFIISGLVMVLSSAKHKPKPLEFVANRITRIVPLYWEEVGHRDVLDLDARHVLVDALQELSCSSWSSPWRCGDLVHERHGGFTVCGRRRVIKQRPFRVKTAETLNQTDLNSIILY